MNCNDHITRNDLPIQKILTTFPIYVSRRCTECVAIEQIVLSIIVSHDGMGMWRFDKLLILFYSFPWNHRMYQAFTCPFWEYTLPAHISGPSADTVMNRKVGMILIPPKFVPWYYPKPMGDYTTNDKTLISTYTRVSYMSIWVFFL